jgi:exodeoxyribonuclease-3
MRRIHPTKGVYTYWNFSYQGVDRNSGLRMDHLLASPSLTETTGEAGVDDERLESRVITHPPGSI